MSDSETHNIKNKNSNIDKKFTTDTDYYFNLIANPNKTLKTNNELNSSESHNSDFVSDEEVKYNFSEQKNLLEQQNYNESEINSNKSNKSNIIKEPTQAKPGSLHSASKTLNEPVTEVNTRVSEYKNTLSKQETRMKKIELLRKLCEIKSKGYNLSKEYDFNSSIDDMEYEYELLKSFADKRNGVKIFKNGLIQAISVVEFLNDKYDPFDFQLSGWSEHLTIETDSWEDVLEELYEKYKGSGRKMAPEIKLLYLLIASASAFHFSKSYASKIPGLDKLLSSNPGLINKLISTKNVKSKFMTPQEINIEAQKNNLNKKEQEEKQQVLHQQNLMKELSSEMYNNTTQSKSTLIGKQTSFMNSGSGVGINIPPEVKSILTRIHGISGTSTNGSVNIKNDIDTQDEASSIDKESQQTIDLSSDGLGSLSSDPNMSENTQKKKQIKKQKKI